MRFQLESSIEIIEWLQKQLKEHRFVSFEVLSPDIGKHYSGSIIKLKSQSYIYRSLKSWIDLANLLQCTMHIPQQIDSNFIQVTFEKLSSSDSFHLEKESNEKYGIKSQFASIDKSGEFAFSYYYLEALKSINFNEVRRIINLGINRGDEFILIKELLSHNQFQSIEFVGIDYSQSAIEFAKNRFSESNMYLYTHDINELESLNLGQFDLLITIATLQSVNSNFKKLFMNFVQTLLTSNSSIIMGFPNSRWIDGELIYGAKVPHYNTSELSTVIKDIYFCKKYLQQHKYRVRIIGKEYLFLIATKIHK